MTPIIEAFLETLENKIRYNTIEKYGHNADLYFKDEATDLAKKNS